MATVTLVKTERSAPREPGAALAVSEEGEVVGSLTSGCVEPALYEEARAVLAGGPPTLRECGIADEDAFEAGLPCGGTVHVFVNEADPDIVARLASAVRADEPVLLALAVGGPEVGAQGLALPWFSLDRARRATARLSEPVIASHLHELMTGGIDRAKKQA
jgi:xanthine dehydrogenase accessory factor